MKCLAEQPSKKKGHNCRTTNSEVKDGRLSY